MNRRKWLMLLCILALMALLGACGTAPGGGTSVWIDVPVDGLHFPDLRQIQVEGHAASPGGISRVELWVNGSLFTTIDRPPAEGSLAKFAAAWTPAASGEYIIQAVAFSIDGTASQPDSTRVLFGEVPITPTLVGCPSPVGGGPTPVSCGPIVSSCPSPVGGGPTPVSCEPVGCPSPVGGGPTPVSCGPVSCPSPVGGGPTPVSCEPVGCPSPVGGGPTPVDCSSAVVGCPSPVGGGPTPVDCITPPPPSAGPLVQFWADPPQIEAGACTTMYWHAENVQKVIFGGIAQPFDGSYKDCLCESQRYTLTVVNQDGSETKHRVEIAVNGSCVTPEPEQPAEPPPPVDSSGPPAPAPAVPADGLSVDCKASQSLVWRPADDPSGIARYEVQVQRHVGDGNWQSAPGGDQSVNDKTTSVPVECGWYYRWRVRAVDGAGNVGGWSGWSSFVVPLT